MKIKSINIAAFGGLKNYQLDLTDGFNVIYGDNENGKTTIMAFVKMMFYGSGRAAAQISKNTRKKYTPWDGSAMAGSIDFEHSGRNYRLEREFKGSNATDKVTLCDLDLGTRSVVPADVGSEFFGITASAFERSVFIGQFGFPEGDPEGEIGKKLSNIALTGEESVSFETVSQRLTKAKSKLMSKSGNAGIYDKNLKAIGLLKTDLERSISINEGYSAVKERIAENESKMAKLQEKANLLKQKISAEQDIRNAKKLENLLKYKAELDALNDNLKLSNGTFADESYVKKLQFCIARTESVKEKINLKQQEIELINGSIQDTLGTSKEEKERIKSELGVKITELENRREETKAKCKALQDEQREIMFNLSSPSAFRKKNNPLLLGLGVAVVVLAIALFFILNSTVSVVTGALGVLLAVLGFVVRPVDKSAYNNCRQKSKEIGNSISVLEENQNAFTEEISTLKAKLEAINTALNGSAESIEKNKQRLVLCQQELAELQNSLNTENDALYSLFARYKSEFSIEEIKDAVEEINAGALKQKELKQQINYILKDVGNISYSDAQSKLMSIKESGGDLSADFDGIKAEYEALVSQIGEIKAGTAAMKARAQEAVSAAENPEVIKAEISRLTATAKAQKEFCDVAQIAIDVLAESYVEVRRSYGSELEKRAASVMDKLTEGKYASMSISKSLDISLEETEKFGSREIDYLSSGTADQAYLSLRLALSRLMADDEPLPILMDDALAQYDDNRLKSALTFLKEYSAENQIILFTCHNSICKMAEDSGAILNKL